RKANTKYNGIGYTGIKEVSLLQEGAIPKSLSSDKDSMNYFLSAKQEIADRKLKDIKLEIIRDSVLTTAVEESSTMRDMLVISEQTSVNEAGLDMNNEIVFPSVFEVPARLK